MGLHSVDVSPSLAFALDVPGGGQVSDDALSCSLGDVEQGGDVSDTDPLITARSSSVLPWFVSGRKSGTVRKI